MAVLDFPLDFPLPAGLTFRLRHNTQTSTSPLTQSVQTVAFPGARWMATISWAELTAQEQRIIKVWLAQLRGQAGRFRLWDLTHPTPAGVGAAGPITVSGAGQVGTALVTAGWPVSTSGLLLPGDYIGVNGELKLVTLNATSNSSGVATLTFEPPLRASPPNGSVITLDQPSTIFRLADDEQDKMAIRPPYRADLTLECVESWS
jgi:hypothetical protein